MNLRQNPIMPTTNVWCPRETEVPKYPNQGIWECWVDVIPHLLQWDHCLHSHNTIKERVEKRKKFWKHKHLPKSCLSHQLLVKRNLNVSSPRLFFYRRGNKKTEWQTHLLKYYANQDRKEAIISVFLIPTGMPTHYPAFLSSSFLL